MGSDEAELNDAKEYSALLSANLPVGADPLSFERLNSKSPYVALCYRDAQFFSIEELARGFIQSAVRSDAVVSTLLARAIIESVAGIWYLRQQVMRALNGKVSPGDLHRQLLRLLTGRRDSDPDKQAIQVLKFIDSVEREVPGFRKNYELLSEYAHPNWDGALGLFSRRDENSFITHFERSEERIANAMKIALRSFNGSIGILLHIYNDLNGQLEKLDTYLDGEGG
jgi:hypothetical protein